MGLRDGEHISRITVHPANSDSDIVRSGSAGPLWRSGGERGLYKTVDGGAIWQKTLDTEVWVGVSDVMTGPANPDILYAAAWRRLRTEAAYIGGCPGSGIHRSPDGAITWHPSNTAQPGSNLGKIGLAISRHYPDYVDAAIELDRTSIDR